MEKTLAEKYDYITFIGVFEYAACYTDNENPFSYMLQLVERHLAPGGKIVIAIENRLGLKYWAGCAEDHVAVSSRDSKAIPTRRMSTPFRERS